MRLPFRRLIRGAVVVGMLLAVAEGALRLGGVIDFPIYETNDSVGYLPRPDQSGAFMNTHRWIFNDKSMSTGPWKPDARPNLLLIGNSVVMGGTPYDQPQKIPPLLESALGNAYSVWPIAVGGWSNVNEIRYLSAHPEVVAKADFFVWEYMDGGLDAAAAWEGDAIFPTGKTTLAVWYVVRRYLLPRQSPLPAANSQVTGAAMPDNIASFARALDRLATATGRLQPGIIFLYPNKSQYLTAKSGREWLSDRALLRSLCAERQLALVDLADEAEWNAGLYRDNTHPTVAGNAVLAEILARHVRSATAQTRR